MTFHSDCMILRQTMFVKCMEDGNNKCSCVQWWNKNDTRKMFRLSSHRTRKQICAQPFGEHTDVVGAIQVLWWTLPFATMCSIAYVVPSARCVLCERVQALFRLAGQIQEVATNKNQQLPFSEVFQPWVWSAHSVRIHNQLVNCKGTSQPSILFCTAQKWKKFATFVPFIFYSWRTHNQSDTMRRSAGDWAPRRFWPRCLDDARCCWLGHFLAEPSGVRPQW